MSIFWLKKEGRCVHSEKILIIKVSLRTKKVLGERSEDLSVRTVPECLKITEI